MNDGNLAISLITESGPMSFQRWAHKSRTVGVFGREHDAQALHGADVRFLRKLTSERIDETGLPVVGLTTRKDVDGSPAVAARQLWLFPDYEGQVAERVRNRDGNHLKALQLAEEAYARYHRRIMIPEIPDL